MYGLRAEQNVGHTLFICIGRENSECHYSSTHPLLIAPIHITSTLISLNDNYIQALRVKSKKFTNRPISITTPFAHYHCCRYYRQPSIHLSSVDRNGHHKTRYWPFLRACMKHFQCEPNRFRQYQKNHRQYPNEVYSLSRTRMKYRGPQMN